MEALEHAPVPSTSLFERISAFWSRHRTAFWMLHSVWALATGIVVLDLARERYGFVPWVVLFLVLTWGSTFFFSRRSSTAKASAVKATPSAPPIGEEVASYLTRSMYQETLFFLIPFYAYSTVVASPNVGFAVVLGGLALFSCFDLAFDHWLRTRPTFGLIFFGCVAFAALNLLLPILLPIGPDLSTLLATGVAVGSAVPLAMGSSGSVSGSGSESGSGSGSGSGPRWKKKVGPAVAAVLLVAIGVGIPQVVPPVPLRLQGATFAADVDRASFEPMGALEATGRSAAAGSPTDFTDGIAMVAEVFAPSNTPTTVRLVWSRDGEELRQSRDIEITAHEAGFRVWDRWRPEAGPVPAGEYRVTLLTETDRVFGQARLSVTP